MYGELIPLGGGDPIPLLKPTLTVGRRESNDIVLRFGNVSGQHCEFSLQQGWWFVKDMNSQNGTRVNGLRVEKKRLDPGDRVTISRQDYEIKYSPADNGGDESRPPDDDVFADIMGRSLMDAAGLNRKPRQSQDGRIGRRKPAGDVAATSNDSAPAAEEEPESTANSDAEPTVDGDSSNEPPA